MTGLRRILADTNILIYAINTSSPEHKPAQEFLQKHRANIFVAHQNVFEALRVLTHPKFPHPMKTHLAQEAVGAIVSAFTLKSPTIDTYALAQVLLKKYQVAADKIFDIYLCATMLSHNVKTIATDNEKDFIHVAEVTVINPFSNR